MKSLFTFFLKSELNQSHKYYQEEFIFSVSIDNIILFNND